MKTIELNDIMSDICNTNTNTNTIVDVDTNTNTTTNVANNTTNIDSTTTNTANVTIETALTDMIINTNNTPNTSNTNDDVIVICGTAYIISDAIHTLNTYKYIDVNPTSEIDCDILYQPQEKTWYDSV